MSRKEDTLMFQNLSQIKVKCKYCGHINTVPVFLDKKNCWFCKRVIHNKGEAYFKYKLRKIIGGER